MSGPIPIVVSPPSVMKQPGLLGRIGAALRCAWAILRGRTVIYACTIRQEQISTTENAEVLWVVR